jgi:glycosyltransferase involved in cell wall biosynthesis
MKLCVIYNFAAHYRAPVFIEIDRAFDCDWYFGKANDDIKKMDYALLKGKVVELETWKKFSITWYRGVLGLLRKKEYDTYIVFANTKDLSTWGFGIMARILHPKKKVYFWSHGWYGKENRLEARIKRFLFRLPSGGTFLYGNHARDLMIKEGLRSDKLFVIYNSLNYDEQLKVRQLLTPQALYQEHFENSNHNIVFIGRLTKVKRFDLLLDAVAILKEKGELVNVTFIGDGIERQNMESMVEEKGILNQVWFYGACYDEKTNAELIYNADLCVSPGNIGLTAMHVMMFGCPAITNDDFACQMPEFEAIKVGKTGDFFQAGNATALAECISAWFNMHGNDRENIRKACFDEIDSIWNPHNQIRILKGVVGEP